MKTVKIDFQYYFIETINSPKKLSDNAQFFLANFIRTTLRNVSKVLAFLTNILNKR